MTVGFDVSHTTFAKCLTFAESFFSIRRILLFANSMCVEFESFKVNGNARSDEMRNITDLFLIKACGAV